MYTYEFSIPILYFDALLLNFLLVFLALFFIYWAFKFVAALVVGG